MMWERLWFPLLRWMRGEWPVGLVAALAAPLAAAALAHALSDKLAPGLAIITFFPAICVATLVGRTGAGAIATVLSTALAWYLFVPPPRSLLIAWPYTGIIDLFVVIAGLLIGIVSLLNKAVDELSSYERRMKAAFSAARMGAWELDFATGAMRWSKALEAIVGREHQEGAGSITDFARYVHPDDRDAFLGALRAQIEDKTRGEHESEFRIIRTDGQARWILTRGEIVRGSDKRARRIIGIAADVTERKDADERFRRVIESDPNGVLVVDSQGRIAFVNSRTEELFGYSRDELQGKPVEMLVPERFRARHAADRTGFFARFEKRPMGTGLELYALRKDGSEFPVEIGLNPIPGMGENLVLAIVLDITERKRAEAEEEKARREAAERFRRVIESDPNGVLVVDQKGRIVLVNARTEEMFGYSREELKGKPVEILVPERFRARHAGERQRFFARFEQRPMGQGQELVALRKDGSEFPVEIGLNPIRDSGEPLVLAIVLDISARVRAHERAEKAPA
jgi:PAS domain S-box-containing protein